MRVLIILAAFLAIASSSDHLHSQETIPIAVKLTPKLNYEYTSSVQTEDYNNYQIVKSIDPEIAIASHTPVLTASTLDITAEPISYTISAEKLETKENSINKDSILLEHKSDPTVPILAQNLQTVAVHNTQPIVHSIPTVSVHSEIVPLVQQTNHALPPVIRSIVKSHEPIIKNVQPVIVAEPTPFIIKSSDAIVTVDQKLATPIVEVDQDTLHTSAVVTQPILTTKSQYHSQDELGRALYGHSEPLQSHSAYQDENGGKTGSFSYIAPNGRLITTSYVADQHGYRAATNSLPERLDQHNLRHRRSVALHATPILRESDLTEIVHNPGHSVSYRIDANNVEAKNIITRLVEPSLHYENIHGVPILYNSHDLIVPVAIQSLHSNVYTVAKPSYKAATLTNIVHNPGHASSYRVD